MVNQTLRSLNATTAGNDLTYEAPEDDFRRFDKFPPELRWRIANNNTKLAAAGFEMHYRWARDKGGAGLTIGRINQIERNEIAVFAGEYSAKYKHELPFLTAGGSIQRYGDLGPSRHPPRKYGKPVMRRQTRSRRRRGSGVIQVAY